MTDKLYKKFAQGLLIVRTKNGSFNSDFSGLPRRLPDNFGTIYATDKALKYCVRKYLVNKNEKIFVWRRYDENGNPLNIDENYKLVFGNEPSKDKKSVIINLATATDVRLFGVTYAGDTNVSLTGTTQISYGVNKLDENLFFNNAILSPYADVTAKEKGKAPKQQTLGNETKTLEAHYVYDFVINPNNLINSLEFISNKEREKILLQESDIKLFKEAMCKGVSAVTSSSKIGSDSELFMFVEMKADEKDGKIESHILPLMKDLVKVSNKNGKTTIDLGDIFASLATSYKRYIAGIELYYDNNATDIIGVDGLPINKKHIVTLEDIS
ncbi:MAG: type I CRISPR-associated protein Cas7 [Rhabdochlamydiaceae bacterium]